MLKNFILITIIIIIFLSGCQVPDDGTEIIMKTYTFKKVGDLEIKADVHRANDTTIRPAVVWIHGGALIVGHRENINNQVKKMLLDAGYAIISIAAAHNLPSPILKYTPAASAIDHRRSCVSS